MSHTSSGRWQVGGSPRHHQVHYWLTLLCAYLLGLYYGRLIGWPDHMQVRSPSASTLPAKIGGSSMKPATACPAPSRPFGDLQCQHATSPKLNEVNCASPRAMKCGLFSQGPEICHRRT